MDRLPSPSRRWALFLDLDGTLIDLAPRPDLVEVRPDMVALLVSIERCLDGALAIVSGRSLAQIDALLAPWRPVAAGEHGAFCRLPSGVVVSPEPPPVPDTWRNLLGGLHVDWPGLFVEQKASAIAVHYRLAPGCEPALRALMQSLVAQRGDAFVLSPAHLAWEIRPRGIHKGLAVERLMREPTMRGRLPVFVGDDVTDEDGMRAAEAMGGHGVHVQRCFPEGAAGVRAWLSGVAKELQLGAAR
jgi:trehalose 6-phosphate phosphatase